MADSDITIYAGTCEKHGDFTGEAIELFGKLIRRGCPACAEERRKKEIAEEAAKAEAKAKREAEADKQRLRKSGVPLRFETKTLETFAVKNDRQQIALSACTRLVDSIRAGEQGANLIFIGKPGTGKSHLACGIILALYRSHRVCRIDLPDLIREIRATWSRKAEHTEAEVLDYFGELDLLIIEEIGTGAGSEDEKARIFQVINRRYEAMLPTILVSNFDLNALEQEIGSRVLDRLREGDRAVLTFDWPSMRGAV